MPGLPRSEYGSAAGATRVEEGEVQIDATGAEGRLHRRVGDGMGAGRRRIIVLQQQEGRRRVGPGGRTHTACVQGRLETESCVSIAAYRVGEAGRRCTHRCSGGETWEGETFTLRALFSAGIYLYCVYAIYMIPCRGVGRGGGIASPPLAEAQLHGRGRG